jgi:hypothetical protein
MGILVRWNSRVVTMLTLIDLNTLEEQRLTFCFVVIVNLVTT